MSNKNLFYTNPVSLEKLLNDCNEGILQLPDFQRSWVWDEDRIKSLIVSVSRAFPIGALMMLDTRGGINFKPRPIEGTPESAKHPNPDSLLLDGQQRITSLYQAIVSNRPVKTVSPRNKQVKRWFYFDIRKSLDESADREDAILGIPEDKIVRSDFGRAVDLDLSSPEKEYEEMMFPMTQVFDPMDWLMKFLEYYGSRLPEKLVENLSLFHKFRLLVLENFGNYDIPVITLDKSTSREAVCTVFEKVNTGGKPLYVFELITAMYAADGYELRKDWHGDGAIKGRRQRLIATLRPSENKNGILASVSNIDFMQAISLFHTRDLRMKAQKDSPDAKVLPAVTVSRQALLNLPLDAYKRYDKEVEDGFVKAAKFLIRLNLFEVRDLPYQSQVVPLAAILADIGDAWEHEANRLKLEQWYWSGVFGEMYGSAVDTRIAKDFMEVTDWIKGGKTPSTIEESLFHSDRLKTMRSRRSAAYKGLNALLMGEKGAKDWRTGQRYEDTVYFNENVDIHHIFPQKWCEDRSIPRDDYDSIINKTPLTSRTNRIIGGDAPSLYISRLEKGYGDTPEIDPQRLDNYLFSHLIDPRLLREDNFHAFMEARQKSLLRLIEKATNKPSFSGSEREEGEDFDLDEDALESSYTIGIN